MRSAEAFPSIKSKKESAPPLPGLHALRGLAALAVLIHHMMEQVSGVPIWLSRVGAAGVDMFFVLSGFLMLYTNQDFFGKSGSWLMFAKRRIIRIVPLYWIVNTIALVFFATGIFYRHQPFTRKSIIGSYFFFEFSHLLNPMGWTLALEMYFYALFCTALILVKHAKWSLIFFAVTLFLSNLLGIVGFGNPICFEFLFGMCICGLLRGNQLTTPKAHVVSALAVLTIIAGSVLSKSPTSGSIEANIRWIVWGIPAAVIVWCHAGTERKLTQNKLLLRLGDISYSLYLTHDFVRLGLAWFLKRMQPPLFLEWLLALCATAASLVVALLVYKMVEKPLYMASLNLIGRSTTPRPDCLERAPSS